MIPSVLIVEDSDEFAERCARLVLAAGREPVRAENAERAKVALRDGEFDLAVIDMMLPPSFTTEGVELVRHLRDTRRPIRVVMMTQKEAGTTEAVSAAMRFGAHAFLDKNSPVFDDRLLATLREIMAENENRVFLSFGHNEVLKLRLKDFLQNRLKLDVVLLSDLPGKGLTIVEQLERVSATCGRAVILLTRDDELQGAGKRARQNVIHEVGFFQGKYGRDRVVLLVEKDVELFTNISGIKMIEFDPAHFATIFEPLRAELET